MAQRKPETIERHFWLRVVRVAPNECWLWRGKKNAAGYGRLYVDGSHVMAHRYAYEFAKGPIPDGLVLDHLCRNPACVNPVHLEPVTIRENCARGLVNSQAQRNHCANGHPYETGNVRLDARGHRVCLTCQRIHQANARRKYREQEISP